MMLSLINLFLEKKYNDILDILHIDDYDKCIELIFEKDYMGNNFLDYLFHNLNEDKLDKLYIILSLNDLYEYKSWNYKPFNLPLGYHNVDNIFDLKYCADCDCYHNENEIIKFNNCSSCNKNTCKRFHNKICLNCIEYLHHM